ncbi:hypothetical protein H9Q16_16080 [Sulfitobacter sp. TSTF-M16]|uniref:Uncharacterized protein n=2 Tax=Sulfitobacter aestuariivivens TaxID=2766981 RepID=A0A927D6T0_9RHOB|nr:hypothetical protein [Sulfitobacter aestuariivivens]MBD3665451.1 hypothetical protein [Sulfitobacter aestuariivivens]
MRRAITVFSLCVAGAAQADLFEPPKGCTAYMTVQSRSCIVKHHWTCEGDAPGEKWHGELNQDGLVFMGQVDYEAQWLDNFYLGNNKRETFVPPAADPQSLTQLIATGTDTYDFLLQTPEGQHRVRGQDSIIERGVTIDGEELLRTEYQIVITDAQGAITYASTGSEFVSETHRRFVGGYGDVTEPGTPFTFNQRPVEFIYPGESGFLDNKPKYDCDVINARFSDPEPTPLPTIGEQP